MYETLAVGQVGTGRKIESCYHDGKLWMRLATETAAEE